MPLPTTSYHIILSLAELNRFVKLLKPLATAWALTYVTNDIVWYRTMKARAPESDPFFHEFLYRTEKIVRYGVIHSVGCGRSKVPISIAQYMGDVGESMGGYGEMHGLDIGSSS
jgi:hypothetical protein